MMIFARRDRLRATIFGLWLTALFFCPNVTLAQTSASSGRNPATSTTQQTSPEGARTSLPPAQYIPSRDFDTKNIKLDLRFDWEREQAAGTETFTFAPLVANLRGVTLDAANMTFQSISLRGAALKFETDAGAEKLRITLDRAYQPNEDVTLVISYRTNGVIKGRSVNGGSGLTFIKPNADDPSRPRQIWSQGETEYNHYWFACYDHPNDFATTEIVATVEKPLMVISNGNLASVKDNTDNTRTFDWRIEQPHASYLTSIVVGDYVPVEQSYDNVPVNTYVYPAEINEGKITAARMADMVRFFSEKTGVKYPYSKYAQTVTRDFNGGMENISATTQTDRMIHDARSELDQTSDSLESHELAHQWFGDYVTCRTWADIWLNESFATYFQAMWDEHSLGRDDFLYSDVKGNQDQYYAAWARGLRRPVVTKNYLNPDAVFDAYAYPRGGAVLHMLRQTLGEDNWWRSINHYLTKYAHQPVETEQFRIAIEETTGQSMDWFFDEWVYRMGHPIFRVTQSYDEATKKLTLNVRQEQQLDANSQYPQVELFQMPIDIEIGATQGARIECRQIEAKREQTLTFDAPTKPLFVNFDYGSTIIKELKFDQPTNELIAQLTKDADSIGRVRALNELAKRAKENATSADDRTQITAALAAALKGDGFWGVRSEAATALKGATSNEAREALLQAAVKDQKSRVRARSIASLAETKDAALANVYQQLLGDQSYAVVRAAAQALGATKNANAFDALARMINTESWRGNVRAAALNGLASLEDARALEAGLRYAQTGNPPAVRFAAITLLGAIGKGDARAFPIISDAFTRSMAAADFQTGIAAAEALVKLGDPRGRQTLADARGKTTNPRLEALLRQFEQRLEQGKTTVTPSTSSPPQ